MAVDASASLIEFLTPPMYIQSIAVVTFLGKQECYYGTRPVPTHTQSLLLFEQQISQYR